ncbi:MAG: hypothetical protein HC792_04860, partial [Acaryochloridaceae cyanobacterium CSU_5_19]|nr:hypothetical protein [Acaryochloridaceae cyanobacterium CSU_5_19]
GLHAAAGAFGHLVADAGRDQISTNGGNDTVYGGAGDDTELSSSSMSGEKHPRQTGKQGKG